VALCVHRQQAKKIDMNHLVFLVIDVFFSPSLPMVLLPTIRNARYNQLKQLYRAVIRLTTARYNL
jgi:hypothetical protein